MEISTSSTAQFKSKGRGKYGHAAGEESEWYQWSPKGKGKRGDRGDKGGRKGKRFQYEQDRESGGGLPPPPPASG